MLLTIKKFLYRLVHNLPGGQSLLSHYELHKRFLDESGWLNSIKSQSAVDAKGKSQPWFTYPALRFLETRIKKEFLVFEYGAGNGSAWWSTHCHSVISVEHDAYWYDQVKKQIRSIHNLELIHRPLESERYQKEILNHTNHFDIIVIDGRERVSCAKNCLVALKPSGIIIWDNSDRVRYKEGFEFLNSKGFKRLDFYGLGPVNPFSWCTSIFYREGNCLDI